MTRVRVSQETCCGAGLCADALPSVFDQRAADGVVVLLDDHPDPVLDDELRAAAFRCPSRAITITRSSEGYEDRTISD
jgi:ferredoxin